MQDLHEIIKSWPIGILVTALLAVAIYAADKISERRPGRIRVYWYYALFLGESEQIFRQRVVTDVRPSSIKKEHKRFFNI